MRPGKALRRARLPAHLAGAALAAWLAAAGVATANPRDAIANGDMAAATKEIENTYIEHGLSWPPFVRWEIGPYTTTYWYYDTTDEKIVAGDMPKPGEIADYWKTWSRALTAGNWDPDGFFVSNEEALQLARFNQYVLATHETAHVMTYRYDPEHRERHGYEINCREYYADRLTHAILQDLASDDADMARWRARYLELVTDMRGAIPAEFDVGDANFMALEADCATLKVEQPSPTELRAYASAYFTRHRALMMAELPPLGEVFATHLEALRAQKAGRFAPADDMPPMRIETLRDVGELETGLTGIDPQTNARIERAVAFDPAGELWQATLSHVSGSDKAVLAFGRVGGTVAPLAPQTTLLRATDRLSLTSLVVFSPDLFFLAFAESPARALVLRASRNGGQWALDVIADDEGFGTANVFRSASGRFFAAFSRRSGSGTTDNSWSVGEFDPLKAGDPLGSVHLPVAAKEPVAADENGRLLFSGFSMLVRIETEPKISRIAGNALRGNRDGDAVAGELTDIVAAQAMPDGSMLLLDRKADDWDSLLVRRLAPL